MVFEVPLANGDTVYMKSLFSHVVPFAFDVVIVSATRLYNACGDTELRGGCPEQWRNDRKFAEIEKVFANCRKYPVPLPIVGHPKHPKDGLLHFDDGITRTMWLLTNGAKYFPVYCCPSCVDMLKEVAGA